MLYKIVFDLVFDEYFLGQNYSLVSLATGHFIERLPDLTSYLKISAGLILGLSY